jgi:hypothetical protein
VLKQLKRQKNLEGMLLIGNVTSKVMHKKISVNRSFPESMRLCKAGNTNFETPGVGVLCYLCRQEYPDHVAGLLMNWKGFGRKQVVMNLFSSCPASCLEGLRKAMKNISQGGLAKIRTERPGLY